MKEKMKLRINKATLNQGKSPKIKINEEST